MGTINLQIPESGASLEELANIVAILAKELAYLLDGNLDVKNVRASSITADRLKVTQLSAIAADMGTITAGSITVSATINVGTDARIGNILYLKETDISGTKGIIFSTVAGNSAKISVLSGDMSIITDGHISLTIGSSQGLVVNQVVNAASIKSNTITNQSNVSVLFSGATTTSVAVADSHNHGFTTSDYIQCYDSTGAPTVKKQWVPYAGSAAHSHAVP